MNTPLFIARRISSLKKDSFSRPILKIGISGIALGVAVMIIAMAIVTGFQNQISDKVIGFGSHIQINKYDFNTSYESDPISKNQAFYPSLDTLEGVRHIQVYAYKAGIVKTREYIQGVVLKGIGDDFDWSFFNKKVIEGNPINLTNDKKSNDVLVSKTLANKLKLKIGDDLRIYFISNENSSPRGRKFAIIGIYETGLGEFDNLFILADIRHIQQLNRWTNDQIAGFEVLLDDFSSLDALNHKIYRIIGYDLMATTIKSVYPQIFNWLDLMDMNVIIILVLMILVSVVTIISILLIIILEHTNTIGVLKALGANNGLIRKIFIYNTLKIGGKGILIGNLIGISICLLQFYFGILKLDQESYYLSEVPINFSILTIVIINAVTLFVCSMMLIVPSIIISRVSPIKAIQFS